MRATVDELVLNHVHTSIATALSGELLTPPDSRTAVHPAPVEFEMPKPAPLRPVAAPDASLADLDVAIAARRSAIRDLDTTIARLDATLAAPPASRLKALLGGQRDDRRDVVRERDAAERTRAEAAGELAELLDARRPYEATSAAYDYDQGIRPALRADIRELAIHLNAAADVLAAHATQHQAADRAVADAMGRSIRAERAGVSVAEIDRRELDMLQRWRSVLVGPHSRLAVWLDDVKAAGIDLNAKGKR